MKKRRARVTERLEANPEARQKERSYIDVSGKTYDITFNNEEKGVEPDYKKIREILKKHNETTYSSTHQHRVTPGDDEKINLPSHNDFMRFLVGDDIKTMRIAQLNTKTGKVEGYYVIRKTRKSPKTGLKLSDLKNEEGSFRELLDKNPQLKEIEKSVQDYRIGTAGFFRAPHPDYRKAAIKELSDEYKLNIKCLSEKGFKYKEGVGFFPKAERKGSLEKRIASIVSGSLIGLSIAFLLPDITGNTISNMANSTSNIIGASLLIVGLVAGFFLLKSREK